MSTVELVYPLDLKMNKDANYSLNQEYRLESNDKILIPTNGFFYKEKFRIKIKNEVSYLIESVDFKFGTLNMDLTLKTGKEVTNFITLLNNDLTPNNFIVDCHFVGGEQSHATTEITKLINELKELPDEILWENIKGKPTAFPPKDKHLHHVNDLYGLEFIIKGLRALKDGLSVGDEAIHKEINDIINWTTENILEHIDDKNNPHNDSKENVGLGNVENYSMASLTDASNFVTDKFSNPLTVKRNIDVLAGNLLQDHTQDFNNPHNDSKENIGLGNVENYSVASLGVALLGESNEHYVTPFTVEELISSIAGQALTLHINDKNNPHNDSKENIGLGNVENYSVANVVEAVGGTVDNKYMTPLRTKEAFNQHFSQSDFLLRVIVSGLTDAGPPYYTYDNQVCSTNGPKYRLTGGWIKTLTMRHLSPFWAYNGGPTGPDTKNRYKSRRIWFNISGHCWARYSQDGDTSRVELRVKRTDTGGVLRRINYLEINRANYRSSNGTWISRRAYGAQSPGPTKGSIQFGGRFYYDYSGDYPIEVELWFYMLESGSVSSYSMSVTTCTE